MRLAARTLAEGRQERMDRRRRDRAAARALREAYPGVQRLRLDLHFDGAKNVPASQSHELHPPAQAFFEFPCPFADCDGQIDLHDAVGAALSDGKRQAHGSQRADLVCHLVAAIRPGKNISTDSTDSHDLA